MLSKSLLVCFLVSCFFSSTSSAQEKSTIYFDSFESYKATIDVELQNSVTFKDSVVAIRNAVHEFYRGGTKHSDFESLGYEESWTWSSQKWFSLFNTDAISSRCGGAASFLSSMYELYGYQTMNVSIGSKDKTDSRGHIQLLVSDSKSECFSMKESYIMDPMFNFHYEKDGALLSIEEMLNLLESGKSNSIELVSINSLALRLHRLPFINPFLPEVENDSRNTVFKSKNTQVKYLTQAPRSIKKYIKGSFKRLYGNIVKEYGYDSKFNSYTDFKYTVLAFREVYNSPCASAYFTKYQTLRDTAIYHLNTKHEHTSIQ